MKSFYFTICLFLAVTKIAHADNPSTVYDLVQEKFHTSKFASVAEARAFFEKPNHRCRVVEASELNTWLGGSSYAPEIRRIGDSTLGFIEIVALRGFPYNGSYSSFLKKSYFEIHGQLPNGDHIQSWFGLDPQSGGTAMYGKVVFIRPSNSVPGAWITLENFLIQCLLP